MSTNSEPPADRGGRDDDLQRLSMTIPMAPDMSNCAGTVHGGLLLTYLDQVAYTCATRWARTYAVTLSVDQVVSREPVHVGELVTFQAGVNRTGRTSMEIGVRVTTEDLVSRVVRHSSSCYFTRVAIEPDGRPVEVPPWRPRTSVERRRHEAAGRRRELRREIERATTEIRAAVHALTRTPPTGEPVPTERCGSVTTYDHHCGLFGTVRSRPPGPVSHLACVDGPLRTAVDQRPTTGV